MAPITRKDFLRYSALSLGGLATGLSLFSSCTDSEKQLESFMDSELDFRSIPIYDVVIVGGGLAGLTCARELLKAGVTNIKVLESRDRVGGRTLNQAITGGNIVEAGGQWVGPGQTAIQSLSTELGIGIFPTYSTGSTFNDTSGSFGLLDALDYASAQSSLNSMANTVPLDAPWTAPMASSWDYITVKQWTDANMSRPAAKELIDLEVETTLGGKSDQVSLLWFLFYIHSAGSLNALSENAQKFRIVGGSQQISLSMASDLPTDVLELNAPVFGIRHNGLKAKIRYNGTDIGAKRVVVAMMPKDISKILFLPNLPPNRKALQDNWVGGPGAKFQAVYNTPFWRSAGRNGQAISDSQFIALSFDNSPPDGSVGVLLGFPADENALPTDPLTRRALTLDSFEHFFGPEGQNAIDFKEYIWQDDPITGGCVSPLPTGLITSYGSTLRIPVGPIHWAGTETSEVWNGYMDGAVRSGIRSANEVISTLM